MSGLVTLYLMMKKFFFGNVVFQ